MVEVKNLYPARKSYADFSRVLWKQYEEISRGAITMKNST